MRVVNAEQVREMDRRAIQEFGIPSASLMENAGAAIAQHIGERYGSTAGRKVVVCCGGGNNGGDGWVAARWLHNMGAEVTVCSPFLPERLRGDVLVFADVYIQMGLPHRLGLAPTEWDAELRQAEIIVDALLGTGLQGTPRYDVQAAIDAINRCSVPVICADIPSGVCTNTGSVETEAVHATSTVTFAAPKLAHFLPPGSDYVGSLAISHIGFDWNRMEMDTKCRLNGLTSNGMFQFWPATASPLLRRRGQQTNKGSYGHLFILAGSRGMAGAAAMAARAAQRSGVGLVTVLTPVSCQPAIAVKLDEQMTIGLPENGDGVVSLDALPIILKHVDRATTVAMGPGLTRAAAPLIEAMLHHLTCSIVLDADALNCLAEMDPEVLRKPGRTAVLTPHPTEAARLLQCTTQEVQADRVGAIRSIASKYQAIVLLKGAYTLIANPEGAVTINGTGNAGMATGGAGDVLTGITGALLCRSAALRHIQKEILCQPEDVVALSALVHGLAGDLAANHIGQTSLIAGDIIAHLHSAFNQLEATC